MSERIYAEPAQPVTLTVSKATTFTVGTGTFELFSLVDGASIIGPTVAGIRKPKADLAAIDIQAPAAKGSYGIRWVDDGGNVSDDDILEVTQDPRLVGGAPAAGHYITAAMVRAEPEVPDTATDAELVAPIDQAEEAIDGWLGTWPVQTVGTAAGRKIAQTDIYDWQWAKLQRAATRLAARLYDNPSVLEEPEYDQASTRGSSASGWRGIATRIPDVVKPLNSSGLRRLGARGRA